MPQLAPGRHFFTLLEIKKLCVEGFQGSGRTQREKLYFSLEDFIQNILISGLRCRVFIDGSFFTAHPMPNDVDVVVSIDDDVQYDLTETQLDLIQSINEDDIFPNIDCTAFFCYPHGSRSYGSALDSQYMIEGYGIEHSKQHLKGYAVLRIRETDVGIRICY